VATIARFESITFALELMFKDVDLIEKFAQNLQLSIPALRVAEKNLASAVALGFGTENASALIKALEKEAGLEVKASRPGLTALLSLIRSASRQITVSAL